MIADKVSINDAYNLLPAGSKLISGNTTRSVKIPEGGIKEVEEVKAVFQVPCGGPKITIIQI